MEKQIHDFAELMCKTGYEDGYSRGYDEGVKDGQKGKISELLIDTYIQGLNDAWECARKIILCEAKGGFSTDKYTEVFGNIATFQALEILSASEAIAKIKEYEEKENKIHVGDEVVSDAFDEKGIVTHITDKSCVSLICGMSSMISTSLDKVHKTGKSYPQIIELLNMLDNSKEDENEQ